MNTCSFRQSSPADGSMRLLTIGTVILSCLLLTECFSQDPERRSIEEYVDQFLNAYENHSFDDAWMKKNGPAIHPDANAFGLTRQYASLADWPIEHPGLNVILDSRVIAIEKKRDHVDLASSTVEDGYFVKVRYSLVAKTVDGTLITLNGPETAYSYLILARDPKDGIYKWIDEFPSPRAFFLSIKYSTSRMEEIAHWFPDIKIDSNAKAKLEVYRSLWWQMRSVFDKVR